MSLDKTNNPYFIIDEFVKLLPTLTEAQANESLDFIKTDKRLVEELNYSWRLKARPKQLIADRHFKTCLFLAGRGVGKSRTATEWVRHNVELGQQRILIVMPTINMAHRAFDEPNGLLNIFPSYKNKKTRINKKDQFVQFYNGSRAYYCTYEQPDRIRGANAESAWLDEACTAPDLEYTFRNLQAALRIGETPNALITTTPKSSDYLHELVNKAEEEGDVPVISSDLRRTILIKGKTSENSANLSPDFYASLHEAWGNTRLGKQELEGELLDNSGESLIQYDWIDKNRSTDPTHPWDMTVIAIDPALTVKEDSDLTGIIVARLKGKDVYILEDCSGRYTPLGWANKVKELHEEYSNNSKKPYVVIETNAGGDPLISNLRQSGFREPIKEIRARVGKRTRCEPVSNLYEKGFIHHVGPNSKFKVLEYQLKNFTGDDRDLKHDDNADALFYAVLFLISHVPQHKHFGNFIF
jgi:predicted phage terminase large subunit-like protein